MTLDLVVRSHRVVTPDGQHPAAVAVSDGRIVAVTAIDAELDTRDEVVLDEGTALLPGLVDTHVHLQDPGRHGWEGFGSGTLAAAAGGVTTVVDMPLDSLPVTVDVDALAVKRAAAQGRVHVDVGFWGGVVPANLGRLHELHEAGVLGFKCFLSESGLAQFPPVTAAELRMAFDQVAALDSVLLVHAEDPRVLLRAAADVGAGTLHRYADFLAAHPANAETSAVATVVRAARESGARAHVVHLSTSAGADLVARARADGVDISAETCPHYLRLAAEDVPDGRTDHVVSPPIRSSAEGAALWERLRTGAVSLVVSDHSPTPDAGKGLDGGDFAGAVGGISSLQLGLSLVWTRATELGFSLTDLVRWMSAAPAALARLDGKGAIAVGKDADLVAFEPETTTVVDPARLHHAQSLTPYAGWELRGAVRSTWLRGRLIHGAHAVREPVGRLLSGSSLSSSARPAR